MHSSASKTTEVSTTFVPQRLVLKCFGEIHLPAAHFQIWSAQRGEDRAAPIAEYEYCKQ